MAGLEAGFESSAERERRKHDGRHERAAYARFVGRIGDGVGCIAADRRGTDDQKLLALAAGRPRSQSEKRSDDGSLAVAANIRRRAPTSLFFAFFFSSRRRHTRYGFRIAASRLPE